MSQSGKSSAIPAPFPLSNSRILKGVGRRKKQYRVYSEQELQNGAHADGPRLRIQKVRQRDRELPQSRKSRGDRRNRSAADNPSPSAPKTSTPSKKTPVEPVKDVTPVAAETPKSVADEACDDPVDPPAAVTPPAAASSPDSVVTPPETVPEPPKDEVAAEDGPVVGSCFVHFQHRGKIIGPLGRVQLEIEQETGVELRIPGREDSSNFVEICAPSASALEAAKVKIKSKIPKFVPKTHFFSIRFGNPSAFADFQTALKKEFAVLEESMFIDYRKLHFTLAVMTIMSHEALQRVKAMMDGPIAKYLSENFGAGSGADLSVEFSHLSSFPEDKPRGAARVIHLQPKATPTVDRLYDLANYLRVLIGAHPDDFGPPDEHDVVLHATVLNAKYGKRSSGGRSRRGGRRGRSNRPQLKAGGLLKKYARVLPVAWMGKRFSFTKLELSKMQTTAGGDGYYDCEHAVSI